MKVGILTFHYSCNYGGVLQSYALQKVLEEMGHDVRIIDFVPSYYRKTLKGFILSSRSASALMKNVISILHRGSLKRAFDAFRANNLNLTRRLEEHNLSSINDEFDAIIVGSDQVWNWNQHEKRVYFINWMPAFNGLRISYAPCCSLNRVADGCKETLVNALNQFNAISVRNNETKMFVKNLVDIDATIVADPTILYDFENFTKPLLSSDYILAYIIGNEIEGGNAAAISCLKKLYPNCTVVGIQTCYDNPQFMSWADQVCYNAGPEEWVRLVANAKCVFTDSFHGTIFSLKFKRDFVCYYSESHRASRFVDMQERYKIGKNIVRSSDELAKKRKGELSSPQNIESLFEAQIKDSMTFLNRNLV